jgi:hypothetical protein
VGDDWLIVGEILDATKIQFRRTAPLRDSPALFRTLAELKPTHEEIREFSSQHGFLLGLQLSDSRNTKRFVLRSGLKVIAERMQVWLDSIALMQALCSLLDAIVAKDERLLRSWIEEKPEKKRSDNLALLGVDCTIPTKVPGWERYSLSISSSEAIAQLLEPGDYVRSARLIVQDVVNSWLRAHTSSQVLYNVAKSDQQVYIVPKNLLGAMCLQFAEALKGDHLGLRRCSQCDSWMGNRIDSEFCSDRCRARAYRNRKRQAKELHEGGMRPSEVARRLGSDTKTVRGWLGLAKKGN